MLVSSQPQRILLAAQGYVPEIKRVQASGSAARFVKAVPGCGAWRVIRMGCGSTKNTYLSVQFKSLLLVEAESAPSLPLLIALW
jgi:hypothetical protein